MENKHCIEKFLRKGELELSEFGITLAKQTPVQKVLEAIPSSRISGSLKKGTYHHFIISAHLLTERVNLRPRFENGLLRKIDLQLIFSSVWPETKQELMEDASRCEKWAFKKAGISLPASFDWGQLRLVVDTISWGTPILIEYY